LGVAMQTLSSPIPQRIAQYESEADRLRRMAEAEPIDAIRDELLAVARQYQQLAFAGCVNRASQRRRI
jgi:hypothetical protein